MYKYYNKDRYEVMEYEFDSLAEFLDYIQTAKTSEGFKYATLESKSNDYKFCKTASLEEAIELCKYGYHKDFKRFLELKAKLDKYIKMAKKNSRQYNYYVGYAPNVKAYLEGSPLSMFNKELPQKKHIDIYYNAAILGDVTTEQIYNRGVITLSLVEILENMGYSVGLNIFTMSKKNYQIHYAKFNLKRSGERLNVQKLYFPMCHPSFLRRLVFRLREVTPDINYDWAQGYGKTCNDSEIRKIIDLKDNDIVICKPDEMGVSGDDIVADANAMLEYIEKFTKDELVIGRIIDEDTKDEPINNEDYLEEKNKCISKKLRF